jgi:hypothetical protein
MGSKAYQEATASWAQKLQDLCAHDAELISIPTEPDWHITGSLLSGFDGPVYRFIRAR